MAESKYPTEVIDLPSHGWFYTQGGPLASGQLELKYMTAKEEDILTSQNLLQKGVVLDYLMRSLIVNKDVKYEDLLLGDINAVMVASRVLGYGKDYEVTITCTQCGKPSTQTIDLTKLEDRKIAEPSTKGSNEFTFNLPVSKKVISFRLLTHADEQAALAEARALTSAEGGEINHELTSRLKRIIIGVDGVKDDKVVRECVDHMIARDSRAFREYYQTVNPDLDMRFSFACPSCSATRRMAIPVGVDFFWPTSEV